MTRRAAALAVLLVSACATMSDPRPAEEAAIRQLVADTDAAFAARDYETFIRFYAEDAVVFFPGAAPLEGREAIRAMTESAFGDPSLSMEITPTHVEVARSGELAYAYGVGLMTVLDPPTGTSAEQRSRWVTVFEKQADGTWAATADIFNDETPAQ